MLMDLENRHVTYPLTVRNPSDQPCNTDTCGHGSLPVNPRQVATTVSPYRPTTSCNFDLHPRTATPSVSGTRGYALTDDAKWGRLCRVLWYRSFAACPILRTQRNSCFSRQRWWRTQPAAHQWRHGGPLYASLTIFSGLPQDWREAWQSGRTARGVPTRCKPDVPLKQYPAAPLLVLDRDIELNVRWI